MQNEPVSDLRRRVALIRLPDYGRIPTPVPPPISSILVSQHGVRYVKIRHEKLATVPEATFYPIVDDTLTVIGSSDGLALDSDITHLPKPKAKSRWLLRLNYYLLRWTCFRLARVLDDAGHQIGWTMTGPISPWKGWQ